MPTIDDLHQAFARLEARTPLMIDTQPSRTATIVELVPATPTPPRRRAALIGSGAAVAATIAGAILVTGLSGGSGRTHVPAGGTVAPSNLGGNLRGRTRGGTISRGGRAEHGGRAVTRMALLHLFRRPERGGDPALRIPDRDHPDPAVEPDPGRALTRAARFPTLWRVSDMPGQK